MKRYIKTSKVDFVLPAGWEKKSNDELEALGYEMADEFIADDKDTFKRNGMEFLGYAISKDGDFGIIGRWPETGKVEIFDIVDDRIISIS